MFYGGEFFDSGLGGLLLPQERKVLIVEDDEVMQKVFTQILSTMEEGLDISIASSPEAAKLQMSRKPFDLVISDYNFLGQRNGLDLWRVCRILYPTTRFLLTSSLAKDLVLGQPMISETPVPYLQKPFTTKECKGLLRVLLP